MSSEADPCFCRWAIEKTSRGREWNLSVSFSRDTSGVMVTELSDTQEKQHFWVNTIVYLHLKEACKINWLDLTKNPTIFSTSRQFCKPKIKMTVQQFLWVVHTQKTRTPAKFLRFIRQDFSFAHSGANSRLNPMSWNSGCVSFVPDFILWHVFHWNKESSGQHLVLYPELPTAHTGVTKKRIPKETYFQINQILD